MKENRIIWKRLSILFGSILVVFLCINVVWFVSVKLPFDGYMETVDIVVDDTDDTVSFNYKIVDGYRYAIKQPKYLEYGGFLSVGSEEGYVVEWDAEGNIISSSGIDISLFIWPNAFKNAEYGVMFWDEANDIFEQIMIDAEGNVIVSKGNEGNVELIEYTEELVAEYRVEIEGLLDRAQQFWDIH